MLFTKKSIGILLHFVVDDSILLVILLIVCLLKNLGVRFTLWWMTVFYLHHIILLVV